MSVFQKRFSFTFYGQLKPKFDTRNCHQKLQNARKTKLFIFQPEGE